MNNSKHNDTTDNHLSATAEIVSSYLLNHKTEVAELETLIQRVYGTLTRLTGTEGAKGTNAAATSDMSVEETITPDYIVCLEDGKKLKMLKRYLKTNYNMTPEEYRKRWNLPLSYPMVAPNYAKRRSDLAKQIGLGRKRGTKMTKRTTGMSGTHKHFKVVKGSQVAALAEIA